MSERQPLWVEDMCRLLAPIEQETRTKLGEEKGGFFARVADDWLKINAALLEAYPGEQGCNLVRLTFWVLFKEVCWFHFFFVTGNYPLLLSRLRFVWEVVFRAYLAEHYPLAPQHSLVAPGPSPDEKLAWLEELEKNPRNLNWEGCIEPVLRTIFPLANQDKEVRDHYNAWWKELHKYVHPSASLTGKMIESANFDEQWALETVDIARKVFDLVWLAVLQHYPEAFERVEKLSRDYPILKMVFEDERE